MIAALAGEAAAQVFIQTSFSGAGCTGTAITTMTLNIAPLMPSGVTFGQCSAISGAWALASCVANNLTVSGFAASGCSGTPLQSMAIQIGGCRAADSGQPGASVMGTCVSSGSAQTVSGSVNSVNYPGNTCSGTPTGVMTYGGCMTFGSSSTSYSCVNGVPTATQFTAAGCSGTGTSMAVPTTCQTNSGGGGASQITCSGPARSGAETYAAAAGVLAAGAAAVAALL